MTTWSAIRLAFGIAVAVLGTLLMVVSAASLATAGTVEGLVGRNGVVTQPLGTIAAAPGDVAVIADGVTARFEPPQLPEALDGLFALAGTDVSALAARLGEFILVVTPPTDSSIFVGVASADEVNGFLGQAPYSVAVREGDAWPTVSVPGSGTTASPEDAGIWTATSVGSPAVLPATSLAGQTLVVMKTTSQPGVEADLRLEYRVPGADQLVGRAAWVAIGAVLVGLVLLLMGAWLIVGPRGSGGRGRHQ
jgi:hypothetical protein